jgi:hypothetical protein
VHVVPHTPAAVVTRQSSGRACSCPVPAPWAAS